MLPLVCFFEAIKDRLQLDFKSESNYIFNQASISEAKHFNGPFQALLNHFAREGLENIKVDIKLWMKISPLKLWSSHPLN